MSDLNPLPAAPVVPSDPSGRAVPLERGLQWLVEGWQLFVKAPGVWVAVSALVLVGTAAIGMVPFIGSIALAFLLPVAFAGLVFGAREVDRGAELRVEHLFLGFRGGASGPLVTVGLYALGATAAITLLMVAIGGGAAISGGMMGRGMMGAGLVMGGILLASLVGLALLVPVSMALWFAPALVLFAGLAPVAALKASFAGCLKNLLPFLLYGVVLFVLMVLAALPYLLGYLVLIPVIAGSIYAAYRDIYE